MKPVAGFIVVVSLLSGTAAMSQELLRDPRLAPGRPAHTLRGWEIFGPLGGAVGPLSKAKGAGGAVLRTTRTELPNGGESWEGCLAANMVEVVPGRRYRFETVVRGDGQFRMGMFEYGWKYSAARLNAVARSVELSADERTVRFEYTPSRDRIACVRPFLRVTGWHKRAEIRRASFGPLVGKADVSVKAEGFTVAFGDTIGVALRSSSYPVKLLLYGPSGDCGPGWPMGGSGAFCDHFKSSLERDGKDGTTTRFDLPIPADAVEGSYRLVAVEPKSGVSATARFSARPAERVKEMIALVNAVRLPKGTRLLFLGDSLTANFPGRNYPALLSRAMAWRFGKDVEVINAGVGGDNILRIAKRLDRDVLRKKPTRVFLFEGANSCKRYYDAAKGELRPWTVPVEKYEAAFRDVLARLTAQKVPVTVMTCAPGEPAVLGVWRRQARTLGDSRSFFCLPDEVARCAAIQKRLAAGVGADILDTNAMLLAVMRERERTNGKEYLHVDDGVHLSEYGSREVARIVLKYLAGLPAGDP